MGLIGWYIREGEGALFESEAGVCPSLSDPPDGVWLAPDKEVADVTQRKPGLDKE